MHRAQQLVFAEQRVQARDAMDRSERVAAAVALKAAGYPVKATPTGVLVDGVAIDVPAASVLRSGDVILRARGKPVRTVTELRAALAPLAPGDTVALRIRRNRARIDRKVEMAGAPGEQGRAIIGIQASEEANIVLPRKVTIDLGNIGGPSAGLPFALQVYQELGKDVDRGLRVAATGEIQLDGSVTSVGGVKQKTIGVERAGIKVFLVPAGDNAREARKYARNVRIIPVRTFQQALRELATLRPAA